MKGFTKGKGKGKKFIPTSRKKQALSKSDISKRELTLKKYIPIDERKKQTLDKLPKYTEEDFKAYHDKINDPAFYGEDEEDAGIPNPLNQAYPEADYWDEYSESNKKIMRKYYTKKFRGELSWQTDDTYYKSGFSKNLIEDPDYPNTAGFWDVSDDDIVDIKTGLTETELQEGQRAKQTLGSFGDRVIEKEDDGTLTDHPKGKPDQAKRFKFGLFGKKSPQQEALEKSEDKIEANEKLGKETDKIKEKQAKADVKTEKQLRKTDENQLRTNEKSIRFLEKQIKGLQDKPAKFGVNAQSQLDVIEQARTDLKALQADTDALRTELNEPVEKA